jgi:DME family drug/metabolite transporter
MLTGLFLISLAAISWGTTGATMALLARDAGAGPLLVGWARMAVAAPCLVLVAVALPSRMRARAEPWTARDAAGALTLGAAMAAYQICYFSAVPRTGVAVTALLAICSAPLVIALLAAAFLGERLTAATRLALIMAVTGAALLVVGPRGLEPMDARAALGALLALGAGVSYAAYATTAKALLARRPPLTVAAATFSTAALLLSPTLAAGEPVREPLAAGWPLLLALGIGPTAVAYALFSAGLARVPATAAGVASLLEPLTAATLGVAWFGERLGAAGWAGGALVVGGLAVLLAAPRPPAAGA